MNKNLSMRPPQPVSASRGIEGVDKRRFSGFRRSSSRRESIPRANISIHELSTHRAVRSGSRIRGPQPRGEPMTEILERPATGAPAASALRILLFEDNAMDVALLRKFLQSVGVRRTHIHHADTIPSALQVMTCERVHLCLADYHLRPHTGFDLMEEARRLDLDVLFIVVTVLDDRQIDEGARAQGAYAFLVKAELTVESLDRTIRYALTSHARESTLFHSAYRDELTHLPSRRAFLERLMQAAADNAAHAGMVGVAVLNLNGTRAINDTLGHKTGDEVLCALARRLKAAKDRGDGIARIGGDEFAVVMSDFLLAPQALSRAQRLVDAVTGPVETQAGTHVITVAGGVASQAMTVTTSPQDAADRLLEQASYAVRTAKRGTRAGTVSHIAFAHLH
ncbi:MAG: diguanylate cyclase [Rhodospirillaceae bacterium]|nr:diguanylate cyclase [Rhodospirillaceae bacterium]